MNWDNLKVVLAISRAGSLAGGAALIGVDQSTASRKLTALEAGLGTSLFVRSKTGLAPTDTGKLVIARAHEVEQRLNDLSDEIAETVGRPHGLVRLLGNGWMLNLMVAALMPGLVARSPDIELRMISRPPKVALPGEATVSLWFEAEPQPGEFSVALGEVHYGVFVRAGQDPDTLPWLSFYDEDNPGRAPMKLWEQRRRSRQETLRFTSSDIRDVLKAVETGVGKAILPICLAETAPDLVMVGDGAPELTRVLHLHLHPDTVQSKRVQAVTQEIRSSFSALFSRPKGPCPAR